MSTEPSRKPTVFIGSSQESLTVVHFIERELRENATVIRWDDSSAFQDGHFILTSLLSMSSQFDFAVLVFGFDDVTISRKISLSAPRDNVIFELGLFMSQLGIDRTFIIAPNLPSKRLKILSDLSGLKLTEYKYTATSNLDEMMKALSPAIERIKERIRELKSRDATDPSIIPGPRSVLNVAQLLEDLITEAQNKSIPSTVLNIALDMEVTWRVVCDNILSNIYVQDLTWKSLMIDPDSPAIQNLSSSTVSMETASLRREQIVEYCKKNKGKMKRRGVIFECRTYNTVPLMHGFYINDRDLLMTLCGINEDKLVGSPNPYWRFERREGSGATKHFFEVFNGWFNYHWKLAKHVWPQ